MATPIKTNHAFTKAQLKALNSELSKISENEIIALKGVQIKGKKNIIDINILSSNYSLDVFLSFTDISLPEFPKFEMYKIDSKGNVDYQPKKSMEFNSLADRISFFNELQPIKFYS